MKEDTIKLISKLLMLSGCTLLSVAASPFVLYALGFTAAGVTAGSIAATIQGAFYGGATAGLFSAAQSAGVVGFGVVGKTIAGSLGASAYYLYDRRNDT